TLNGAPAQVVPGYVEAEDLGSSTICPVLHWDDVAQLGDMLDVEIVDGTRPVGDPYRPVSTSFRDPRLGTTTGPGSGAGTVHPIHAGDRIELQAPADETVWTAIWDAGVPGVNAFDDGTASVHGSTIDLTITSIGAGGPATLQVMSYGWLEV